MARASDLKLTVDRVSLIASGDAIEVSNLANCSVERVGRFLYVTGHLETGNYNNRKPTVAVLDIGERRWRCIEYEGKLLKRPFIFLYNDELYGYCASTPEFGARVEMFRLDLNLEEWSKCNVIGTRPLIEKSLTFSHYHEKLERFVIAGYGPFTKHFIYLLAMPECRWIKAVVKGRHPFYYGAEEYEYVGSCSHKGAIYLKRMVLG